MLEYVRVLAWPAVVLVAAVMFRSPVSDLLDRVVEASGFGGKLKMIEASMRRAVAESKVEASAVPDTVEDAESASEIESASASVDSNIGKILVTSVFLEKEARDAVVRSGANHVPGSFRAAVQFLHTQGLIGVESFDAAMKLADTRARVAHNVWGDLNDKIADDFVHAATNLRKVFAAIGRGTRGQTVSSVS